MEIHKPLGSLTLPEMKAELETYLGFMFGLEYNDKLLDDVAKEFFKFHGKLFIYKFREICSLQAQGLLKGIEKLKPEFSSMFFQQLKKSYFAAPTWPKQQREKERAYYESLQND